MKVNNILYKPFITEKSTLLARDGVYLFEVNPNANKHQIAELVGQLYGVEVKSVKTTVRKGKVKTVGRKRSEKKQPDTKIAYVSVSKGTIDIFPQA